MSNHEPALFGWRSGNVIHAINIAHLTGETDVNHHVNRVGIDVDLVPAPGGIAHGSHSGKIKGLARYYDGNEDPLTLQRLS